MNTFPTKIQRHYKNKAIRRERLRVARLVGTHTILEWELLKKEFNYHCVICGTNEMNVEKDHIVPLHSEGSSDSISNIQPVCAPCNCKKTHDETNWVEYRRKNGFKENA